MEELVQISNNEVVCDSLKVAEKFGKRHDNVLSSIRGLLKNKDTEQMFTKGKYTHHQNGQEYEMYYMNRDGFSLLVMGFTGDKALEWKISYIKAFNKMEELLREQTSQEWIIQRHHSKLTRHEETNMIQKLVDYAKNQGSEHSEMLYMTYSKLANRMTGISDRDKATAQQLSELSLIENIILNQIRIGMGQELHYKQIYQECKNQIELFRRVAYLS